MRGHEVPNKRYITNLEGIYEQEICNKSLDDVQYLINKIQYHY
jgi:hypothetical protein